MAKLLFTCFGSFGDLFPYLALAKALQKNGHEVSIGTTKLYKEQIESEGIVFIHIRSSLDKYSTSESIREFAQRIFASTNGGELIAKEMMKDVDQTYFDTVKAVNDADLVVSHPLAYTTPLVCRDKNVPWLSTMLAPMFFLSVYDPPILAPAPWLKKVHDVSPVFYRWLFKWIKLSTKPWMKPLYRLCEKEKIALPLGLPVFEGQYSPYGTLAMFAKSFAEPQVDWPVNTTVTGFPFFSSAMEDNNTLDSLQKFIASGDAPIVFALGSAAVNAAKDFYEVSANVARKLNRRAILVCGEHGDYVENIQQGDDVLLINYVAYAAVFPHACLIVHQGGIGTLALSLCAQRPVVVVPFGFDQLDNGDRIEKLSIGKCILRKNYQVEKVVPIFDELLGNSCYREKAEVIGRQVQAENGVDNAVKVIEKLLAEIV